MSRSLNWGLAVWLLSIQLKPRSWHIGLLPWDFPLNNRQTSAMIQVVIQRNRTCWDGKTWWNTLEWSPKLCCWFLGTTWTPQKLLERTIHLLNRVETWRQSFSFLLFVSVFFLQSKLGCVFHVRSAACAALGLSSLTSATVAHNQSRCKFADKFWIFENILWCKHGSLVIHKISDESCVWVHGSWIWILSPSAGFSFPKSRIS